MQVSLFEKLGISNVLESKQVPSAIIVPPFEEKVSFWEDVSVKHGLYEMSLKTNENDKKYNFKYIVDPLSGNATREVMEFELTFLLITND